MSASFIPFLGVVCALCALGFAGWKSRWILAQGQGNERIQEIGAAIREGAMAFLRREYQILSLFVVVVAALLAFFNQGPLRLVALSFVVGALCSGIAGFIGMRIATQSNSRTTHAASTGLNEALQIAFSGGTVMGVSVVGLGLLGISSLFLIYTSIYNTTAAIGKGFAIGSAALTALALFAAFRATVGIDTISITDPLVMVGLFLGAMLPYLFSSMAMNAVGRAAFTMIEEVRRQFREIPGLLEGTGKADYARCVDISTRAAIREMVLPALLGVVTPVLVGFLGGAHMLGGLLAGVTVSGVMMALFMSNAGGAWDNAKKYIESGHHGGKGSDAHHAAVTGDTVGDPFKDTAGPALNILIKLMSVVALVIAPML